MISLQQFIANTQGQSLLYPPNKESLRSQCVQPCMYYMEQVWGQSPYWRSTASQYFTAPDGRFNYTANNPDDPNQLPPVGSLIVWDASLPGSGGSGHIAIFLGSTGQHTFTSYDSNWAGKYCHTVSHNWLNVVGWITPKQFVLSVVLASATITTNGDTNEMIQNETQAHQAYKLLRPNGDGSADEIAATAGHRTWAQFVNDGQNEVNQRDQNLRDQAAHLTDQQNLINQQNQTITDLTNSGATTKQEYDEALSKIADLNAQLATKHDLLSDLSTKLTAAIGPTETVITGGEIEPEPAKVKAPSWTTKFFMWMLSRRTKKS